jgi:hypothetical protein
VIGGLVLDASALGDLAENRTPYAAELVDTAIANLRVVCVPATALMECWAQSPEQSQTFLAMFTGLSVVVVDVADETTAIDAGALAAEAGQPKAPAGTMHAVLLARTRKWPILTWHPQAVWALDPDVAVESLR